VVHRDIKPENICCRGHQSWRTSESTGDHGGGGGMQTPVGTTLGTPAYMSPEQVVGSGTWMVDPISIP